MTRSCLRRTPPRRACSRWRRQAGPATVLTRPNRARGEADHVWPELLPGGRAVLFTILPVSGGVDAAQVAVLDRQTGTQTVVVRGGSHAHYVRSGHLVYAAANTLRAVAFDPVTLQTRGTPIPVVPEVVTTIRPPGGGVDCRRRRRRDTGVCPRGGVGAGAGPRTLVWVDRQGRETPIAAPPRSMCTRGSVPMAAVWRYMPLIRRPTSGSGTSCARHSRASRSLPGRTVIRCGPQTAGG